MKKLVLAALACSAVLTMAACSNEKQPNRTAVKKTEQVKTATVNTGEKASGKIDKGTEKVKKAWSETKEKVKEEAKDVKKEVQKDAKVVKEKAKETKQELKK